MAFSGSIIYIGGCKHAYIQADATQCKFTIALGGQRVNV